MQASIHYNDSGFRNLVLCKVFGLAPNEGGRMMAKLYWRVKRNGKWTWKPAMVIVNNAVSVTAYTLDRQIEEEEE